MNMTNLTEYKAQWIGGGKFPQAPYFRREFELGSTLKTAIVRICGLGYYELHLNGSKVGDHVLDPIVTQYDQRVRSVNYDVAEQLRQGVNAIGVILGNGWYNCSTPDAWNFERANWRDHPKFNLCLELTFDDGTVMELGSNSEWTVCVDSPIRFNALRNGETYDARLAPVAWDLPGFDDHSWKQACIVPGPGGVMEEQTSPPCKVMDDIVAKSVNVIRPGVAVFDLGVNIAGWALLRLSGSAGQEITLRYSDLLCDNGEVDTKHLGKFVKEGDFQTDRYILKGDGIEHWEPRFTYHGFRYVQLEGFSDDPTLNMVTGRVVHTAFDSIGSFECSNPDLNALQASTRRSFISNFVGIPTDCPHREKNGWTGDAQLAAETGLMNYDVASSYAQWLQTMADTQRPSGQFPGIVPSAGWGYNWGSGPAWDNAFILIPWYIYQHTGDSRLIKQHYDAMRRYMDYCETMATENILSFGLGDWCAFGKVASSAITSTGYYYIDACIMSELATIVDRPGDIEPFAALAAEIKVAFNKRFYKGNGIYGEGEMTAMGCALYQGLVGDAEKADVVAALVAAIKKNDYKADFGILGAKYIPRALADNGELEVAYKLIAQDAYPGWLHWLRQGATTLWESWNGNASHNHIMFGDVSAWMFSYLAGIRPDTENPGFIQVCIRPGVVKDLQWVKASYDAPTGTMRSAWKKSGEGIEYTIELPAGIIGELVLEDGFRKTLAAGVSTIVH